MASRAFQLAIIAALTLLISACGSGSSRYGDPDNSHETQEGLCTDEEERITALENQLEEARAQLEALEKRKAQLQSAADDLRANVDRLALENWRDVVPDIDASAADVEDEADQMENELSEAASVLEER